MHPIHREGSNNNLFTSIACYIVRCSNDSSDNASCSTPREKSTNSIPEYGHLALLKLYLRILLKAERLSSYCAFSPLERISMTDVTISQLIAYDPERDLLPLILAHCNYSLEVGQETFVQYDWTALERQLTDRFLKGRPFVVFKVHHFRCVFFCS